jgi:hypothetical protein
MPSIGQTWVLTSIGAVVEMGILSTLKRLLMESRFKRTDLLLIEEEASLVWFMDLDTIRLFHGWEEVLIKQM